MHAKHLRHQNNPQQPVGNVYIVTESPCVMLGIESLQIITVPPAQEAAFLKAYAGRILATGAGISAVLTQLGLSVNDLRQ